LNAMTDGLGPDSGTNVGLTFSQKSQLTQVGRVVNGAAGSHLSGRTIPRIYSTNPLYYGSWTVGYPPIDIFTDQHPGD
jgi:hypothetical protein